MSLIFPSVPAGWAEQIVKVLKYFLDGLKTRVDNLEPVVKTDTGHPSNPREGTLEINTFDNKVFIYADAGWRQIATW